MSKVPKVKKPRVVNDHEITKTKVITQKKISKQKPNLTSIEKLEHFFKKHSRSSNPRLFDIINELKLNTIINFLNNKIKPTFINSNELIKLIQYGIQKNEDYIKTTLTFFKDFSKIETPYFEVTTKKLPDVIFDNNVYTKLFELLSTPGICYDLYYNILYIQNNYKIISYKEQREIYSQKIVNFVINYGKNKQPHHKILDLAFEFLIINKKFLCEIDQKLLFKEIIFSQDLNDTNILLFCYINYLLKLDKYNELCLIAWLKSSDTRSIITDKLSDELKSYQIDKTKIRHTATGLNITAKPKDKNYEVISKTIKFIKHIQDIKLSIKHFNLDKLEGGLDPSSKKSINNIKQNISEIKFKLHEIENDSNLKKFKNHLRYNLIGHSLLIYDDLRLLLIIMSIIKNPENFAIKLPPIDFIFEKLNINYIKDIILYDYYCYIGNINIILNLFNHELLSLNNKIINEYIRYLFNNKSQWLKYTENFALTIQQILNSIINIRHFSELYINNKLDLTQYESEVLQIFSILNEMYHEKNQQNQEIIRLVETEVIPILLLSGLINKKEYNILYEKMKIEIINLSNELKLSPVFLTLVVSKFTKSEYIGDSCGNFSKDFCILSCDNYSIIYKEGNHGLMMKMLMNKIETLKPTIC